MSTSASGDPEAMGYFLPEGSRLRLERLREHVAFLSHLARPRTVDLEPGGDPGVRADDVATCLAVLAEQLGRVLDEIAGPALRRHGDAALGGDAKPGVVGRAPGDEDGGGAFGITLGQIDRLDRLIDMIWAHGDVVAASGEAELAACTLSLLGHAICGDAQAAREVVRQVASSGRGRGSQGGVGEERAGYMLDDGGRARLPAGADGMGRATPWVPPVPLPMVPCMAGSL